MIVRILLLTVLSSSITALGQDAVSRADVQAVLGFEDQTSANLVGWHTFPQGVVFADDHIAHSGHWSVRMQRDTHSTGPGAVITRHLPIDFQGNTVELRGYLRLENVSDYASLWMREDVDGQLILFQDMHLQRVNGTRAWAEYKISLPLNPQAQVLYFGVIENGTGTTWADDLQLLVDGKPIAQAPATQVPLSLPEDHSFEKGSGLQIAALTPLQIDNLATLGRVWGFLKYFHPVVTSGKRNWDVDLLRILPEVLAASDRAQANDVIFRWVNALGPIPPCSPCVSEPSGDVDQKPQLDWLRDESMLGTRLSTLLQKIYVNRSGLQFFVMLAPNIGNPVFLHEPSYPRTTFPDFGYQILALFRWWNIMQYWAPDRDVAGQDWPAILRNFIPKVALAHDKTAYTLALFQLIATANDTHANLWNSLNERPPTGDCTVPADLRFIGNKPVFYHVFAGDDKLRVGDLLVGIDGIPIQSLVSEWSKFYADSNEAARLRDLAAFLTRGSCAPVTLNLKRNSKALRISVQRIRTPSQQITHDQSGDRFQLLSPTIAYLKLPGINASDLPSYFEKAKNTKGIIIDLRNYPEYVLYAIGQYFALKPTPFISFTFPDLSNPGTFKFRAGPAIQPGPEHYQGRLVILVDEITQSRAEFTAMALRAMPNALVLGSTTAGADGDTSSIQLPGGVGTMISGLGVFYPDHRPTQRIGIVPDVVVRPTAKGIAAGRDKVLQKAIHLIEIGATR